MTPVKGLILFLLFYSHPAAFGDVHSLEYLYTIHSKTSDSNIYDCTAVTLLDDREIDFYSSTDESRTPKQNWVKNILQSDWKNSTEKLQYDTQLLHKLITSQKKKSGDSESGGHVLQWRHGCKGEQHSDGSLTLLNSSNEFGYDGEDLIQFNCNSETWRTPENKKSRESEKKWSKEHQHTGVNKCAQCVEMLKMYLKYSTAEQYRTTDITQSQTPPAVHRFAKKSVRDSSKLILICMATGFYPKDVEMSLRKFGTSFPEHLLTSSGVRPNDDGTYQLRKSVEISDDGPADYCCYVFHSSLTEPVIKKWVNTNNGAGPALIGGVVGVVIFLILLVVILIVLKMKGIIGGSRHKQVVYIVPQKFNTKGYENSDLGYDSGKGTDSLRGSNENIQNIPKGPKNRGYDCDSGTGSDFSSDEDEDINEETAYSE